MSRELERAVAAEQAEHERAQAADFEPDAVSADMPADDAGKARRAAEAVAWLDESLKELRGSLQACGQSIDEGALDPVVVSSKMNAVVMELMGGAAG